MNLHEYQAKQIFREHGIPVLPGVVATTVDQAMDGARGLGGDKWVVKAQIHAGGRGAGTFDGRPGKGGVRVANSIDEVADHARAMLNHVLVTAQTGPTGREVKRVYVEQHCASVQRELYLAMLVERGSGELTLLASAKGGVNIESVGTRSPDAIHKRSIDLDRGPSAEGLNGLMQALNVAGRVESDLMRLLSAMHRVYVDMDATLIEINPLAVTQSDEPMALDATVVLDDNALFRHPEFKDLRDADEFMVGELEAASHGLNYIKLDGNIGCMASGAGLSLATIDAVKLLGGEPANFLDIPPVAEVERVTQALQLVATDPDVKCILINVFGGGIMRCDTIADALTLFNRKRKIEVPIIARLAGTNADFAMRRLRDMGPEITFAVNMAEAAKIAVDTASVTRKVERGSWWRRVMGAEKS